MSVLHSRVDSVIGSQVIAVDVVAAASVAVDVVAGAVQVGGSGKVRPRPDLVSAETENVSVPRRDWRLQGFGFGRVWFRV